MNKTDSIARRILGWKLNRSDRWFDYENNVFIHDSDFQPEHNLEHAKLIIDKLEEFGFTFKTISDYEVCFNDIRGTGDTLAEAITDAAYSIIELNSEVSSTRLWQKLC